MTFADRVAGVLGTRVVQLASTLAVSFVLARILGPSGRGVYALVILVPTTLFAFSQFGLVSAVVLHAGRGGSLRDLERHSIVLGALVTVPIIAVTLLALPALETNALRSAPDALLRLALIALPLRLVATVAGNVLYGRGRFRAYNAILAVQSVLGVVLALLLVGALAFGVDGAVWAYLLFLGFGTVAVVAALDRYRRGVARTEPPGEPVGARALLGFGLRLYPSSIATFLGYRLDVFLLGWLVGSSSDIGIYAVAVSVAELVFNLPDAVGTVLFPRMAGADRAEADRLAPRMSRMTILVTAVAAVAIIPAAWIALVVLLPEFVPGMVPLVLILPGIVALSVAKVLTSYLSGIERLAPMTWASLTALVVNVGANLVLIPAAGIAGAAGASLLSYGLYGALMVVAASRASGAPIRSFVAPGREDAARLGEAAGRLVRRRTHG